MNPLEEVKGIMQIYMLVWSLSSPRQDSLGPNNRAAIPRLNFSSLPAGAVLHLQTFSNPGLWDWDLSGALFSCALKAVL